MPFMHWLDLIRVDGQSMHFDVKIFHCSEPIKVSLSRSLSQQTYHGIFVHFTHIMMLKKCGIAIYNLCNCNINMFRTRVLLSFKKMHLTYLSGKHSTVIFVFLVCIQLDSKICYFGIFSIT